MATGFSPGAPSEKTRKATHLFPLLSRRWPPPFLELLLPMGGMDHTNVLSKGVSAALTSVFDEPGLQELK